LFIMAELLAVKPATPRHAPSGPSYPALAAVALSFCLPACIGPADPSGANPASFSDAMTDPSSEGQIDGGRGLDAESEATTVDGQPAPATVDASADDVP